jgi:hypothetical protein
VNSDNPRNPDPVPHPVVLRLQRSDGEETEDVIALVGFVGPRRDDHVRIFPDPSYQRWLAIPADAIVDSEPAEDGRTFIWVTGDAMRAEMFTDNALAALDAELMPGGGMSTWNLLPDTRYVAAGMLDLLVTTPVSEGAYP